MKVDGYNLPELLPDHLLPPGHRPHETHENGHNGHNNSDEINEEINGNWDLIKLNLVLHAFIFHMALKYNLCKRNITKSNNKIFQQNLLTTKAWGQFYRF